LIEWVNHVAATVKIPQPNAQIKASIGTP